MWTDVFAGSRARRTLPDLLELVREWRPDLIVRDMTEFAGCVAAESFRLPHAAVQLTAFRPELHSLITPQINQLRLSVGLPPDPQLASLYRYLLLTLFPPSYQDPTAILPPTLHAIRHAGFNSSGDERLPGWVDDLPERPTIYATLGTVVNRFTDVLRAIADGLAEEPVDLILTTGRNVAPGDLGTWPSNVHLERYIPQSLVLPCCDLVITHGGSGTVKDALSHGLPMVIIPIAADQHENAARCADLGVARVIEPECRTPEAIREAVREMLGNAAYRQNAEALRDEIEALPGIDYAVSLLKRLASEKAPLLAAAS
jgi:UDP:flavonoid glycosyltransferase YjiC (YdhE family)